MSSTSYSPPPAQPPAAPQHPAPRPGWITPLVAVVGGLALLVTVTGATVTGIRALGSGDHRLTVSVEGIDTLDVDVSSGSFTLEYGRVSDAVLDVDGSNGWELRRSGSTLEVRPPVLWFGWWFGGSDRVVLTLPESTLSAGWDARFDLSAGDLRVDGEFDSLELGVSAGEATVTGSASDVRGKVSAGTVYLTLADVVRAELDVSAGRMDAGFSGSAPESVGLDVSAGELNLVVPEGVYDVRSDVSAGSFDNDLDTASASPLKITVDVSAGSASARSAR